MRRSAFLLALLLTLAWQGMSGAQTLLRYSQIGFVPTATVLGRNTAGTGAAEALGTLPTAVQANITGTGALNSGSITSGFGSIDVGADSITGGAISGTTGVFSTSVSTPSIVTASGALTVTPAAGSNLNVDLSTTGDFAVNTDDLYVDTSTGNVGIGTTSPATKLDVRDGLISVSDQDVAHGMTSIVPTEVYGNLGPSSAAAGGFDVIGLSDAAGTTGLFFTGIVGDETPTVPSVVIRGGKKNGTTWQASGSSETVFQIRNFTTNLITVVGSGDIALSGKITTYNNIATAGNGIPSIYGSGRSTAQTAAVASVATYTVGAADASFDVAANVNVTTSTLHNFAVQVDYTDETNTARTLTLPFAQLAGTLVIAITNGTGAGPYEGVSLRIRCKASTTITVKTTGTFTTVTYNVEATIAKVA